MVTGLEGVGTAMAEAMADTAEATADTADTAEDTAMVVETEGVRISEMGAMTFNRMSMLLSPLSVNTLGTEMVHTISYRISTLEPPGRTRVTVTRLLVHHNLRSGFRPIPAVTGWKEEAAVENFLCFCQLYHGA